eukprot:gene20459-24512_t
MVACWQSVGFTHGVLNTDNMSILGLTIDYGPFGFMDTFDPQYTPNITDLDVGDSVHRLHEGQGATLISFHRYPAETVEKVGGFVLALTEEYFQWMAGKFGMVKYDPEMGLQYMQLMARHRADFTLSFRLLSELPSLAESFELSDAQLVEVLEPALPPDASGSWIPEWGAWVRRYLVVVEEGLAEAELSDEERRCRMDSHNPLYIPRNYLLQVEVAIEATEKGNHAPLLELLQVLKTPYVAQDGMHAYAHPAPDWARKAGIAILS